MRLPCLGGVPEVTKNDYGARSYGTSYPGCMGSGSWSRFDGMFYITSESPPVRTADVIDGSSKTALFGEWVPTKYLPEGPSAYGFLMYVTDRPPTRDAFLNTCLSFRYSRQEPNTDSIAADWHDGFETMYNHQLQPNLRSCGGIEYYKCAHTSSSFHDGIVHVAFVDGHVEEASESIGLEIWRALGSRNGNEN